MSAVIAMPKVFISLDNHNGLGLGLESGLGLGLGLGLESGF
jgi:hypothetical protein